MTANSPRVGGGSACPRGSHRPSPRGRREKRLREQLADRAAWISACVVAWAVLRLVDAFHPLVHLLLGVAT